MSQGGCATRWREGQDATGHAAERLAVCRSCPIGAAHAGETFVHHSRLYGASICPRCRRGAMRIIHGRVCVSCWNRERELRIGRNARGNPPVQLLRRPLHPVEVTAEVDGLVRRVRAMAAIDCLEVVFQTLRTEKGEILFGRVERSAGGAV